MTISVEGHALIVDNAEMSIFPEILKRKIRPLRRIVRGLADDSERSGSIR